VSPDRLKGLLQELVDENPFVIRAVLRICEVRFTDKVPTLAVTCEDRPALLVNLDFISENCRNDSEVKAALCHEFLHVLLRHTETIGPITPARHLALDAVINAIIHRSFGPDWSSLMSHYYQGVSDLRKLLRPMNAYEKAMWDKCRLGKGKNSQPSWVHAWASLYEGRLVADDIAELAESFSSARPKGRWVGGPFALSGVLPADLEAELLGDHSGLGQKLDPRLADALAQAMTEMNGQGIWRNPSARGVGAYPYDALFTARPSDALVRWRRNAMIVLKRHLTPDRKSRPLEGKVQEQLLPVLSTGDRRAFLRARWSPFLPESIWKIERRQPAGTAQIYLDVSGSMSAEMPELVDLLHKLSRYIRRPFWAFSDEVAPAAIQSGRLVTRTSGGTSMACVLKHVALTNPGAAIVVTDGYIEEVPRDLVRKAAGSRLHVLLTRDGSATELARAGIPYTQLERRPQ
jgi:hypothetical protein